MAKSSQPLYLEPTTDRIDVYENLHLLYDNDQELSVEAIVLLDTSEAFTNFKQIKQKTGYYTSTRWLRFDVQNDTNERSWILEFAFPLIYQIDLYTMDADEVIHLQTTGSNYPFHERELKNRYFGLSLDISPHTTRTYYVKVIGGGDLYPPISIWNPTAYAEKNQVETTILGLFYGMIFVMIMYNFFLFIALRMRSYLYYVLTISSILIANLAADGFAFQYFWPNQPAWNANASIFWVTMTCMFILLFTKSFLDTRIYAPKFTYYIYSLIGVNALTLITLLFSRNIASNLMTFSALVTFLVVLAVGFISLIRGARQARFFIIGWLIFLIGVSVTILERIAVIPYSIFTEYAGQFSLAVEVMLLSFALADKINIMRLEKSMAKQEAIHSQKIAMESLQKADQLKDDFLAVTSHELKTPLHGMIGIAESLRDGVTGTVTDKTKEQLELIITSGNRLSHLVNDILDFTEINNDGLHLKLKPVHLFGLVEAIFTICQPLIKEKQIKLVNQIPESFPSILADQNRLQQIFYNLIGNAIKYTDKGDVSISVNLIGSSVAISVKDTGPGISIQQQKVIFKPFTQGEDSLIRSETGSGIGLNITKELIRLHGGKLTVDSHLGKGTTFLFTLPIARDEKLTSKDVSQEISATLTPMKDQKDLIYPLYNGNLRNKATIVVADDEIINLQVLTNHLHLEGYKVITVSSGEAVFDIVHKQAVDLVILDIMMPKVSGYEVCQRLRERYSLMELPILMLTAKNQTQDRITAFELGANDYLVKPCDKSELVSRVKTLLRLKYLNQELYTMNTELEEMVKERTLKLRKANIDLKRLNDNLLTMAKSRRQLLANIAHELGTPVMMVHSYLQALQGGLIDSTNAYYNDIVHEKITLLNRLINDLSDLALLEGGQTNLNRKGVHLNEWLLHTCNKIKFDTERFARTFEMQIPNNPDYKCYIDTVRMDQVFMNLVSNAVKNTEESDGKISVSASIHPKAKSLSIDFTDNGFGMDQAQLPNLFERFYQAPTTISDDTTKGTGLGLAIVKEIIHGHEGKITVKSTVDIGTTFSITLPIEKNT